MYNRKKDSNNQIFVLEIVKKNIALSFKEQRE